MPRFSSSTPPPFPFLVLQLVAMQVPLAKDAELKPETVEGFSRYVRATEVRVQRRLGRSNPYSLSSGLDEKISSDDRRFPFLFVNPDARLEALSSATDRRSPAMATGVLT